MNLPKFGLDRMSNFEFAQLKIKITSRYCRNYYKKKLLVEDKDNVSCIFRVEV